MRVRYQYIFIFSLGGVLALYRSATADAVLPMVVLSNVAVALIGVGLAFGLKRPGMFMKTPNGRMSFLSYLCFWPYFALNHLILRLYRLLSKENPIDEIIPGLYLGCKLWPTDKEKLTQRGISAVVDVTSEWGETGFILKNYEYLSVPVLDSCPPTLDQLREAVQWIEERLEHGGVFVHCAVGHGRSATIIAAYLLHAQNVSGLQNAIDFIKRKRPKINLNHKQLSTLHKYWKPSDDNQS